jgi:hypothetical protein
LIYILIENVRRCKIIKENETIRVGDNRMTDIKVEMPSTFGTQEYPREDCSVEMRCYISEDEYLGYTLNTSDNIDSVPVTTDLTEKIQDITISFVITHSGNVIGTTNSIILSVAYARNNGQELTPREEFDRVINEQRQMIATQRLTIEEQTEQIEQDSETIGSLNNRVDELTSENEELSEQNSVYLDTIDELNKRVPAMETPEPVTPTGETQVIRPSENYAGLASVTVDRVTAAADSDIQPENIKEGIEILGVEGSYNPFPEQSYGGVYILEKDQDGRSRRILVKNFSIEAASPFQVLIEQSPSARGALKEFVFDNCPYIFNIANSYFYFCSSLEKIVLPENLVELPSACFAYGGLTCVKELIIPNSVTNIGNQALPASTSLETMHIPAKLSSVGYGNGLFQNSNNYPALRNLTIGKDFNFNGLNFSGSKLLSVEVLVNCLKALADRTGETAYTLTMGATNLNKLTDEQKAIAIGKNWNLA